MKSKRRILIWNSGSDVPKPASINLPNLIYLWNRWVLFWKHFFWKTSQPKCVPFTFKFYFSKFWNVFVRNNYFVFKLFFSHWYEVTFKFAYTPRRACKLTKPRYNYTSARTNTKFNTNPTPHTTKASSFSNQSTTLIKLLIKNNFTTRCGFSITRHKARTTSTM